MGVTVFTPTYNRCDTLKRLYKSLDGQTSYDFEWLIIDDGSTDNTECVVKEFSECSKFPIHYYKQENGGKHRAYNKALKLAEGDFFFTVDSDDWLEDDAIEKINLFKKNVNDDNWFFAYKTDDNGNLLSNKFPENITSTTYNELSCKFHCNGEFSIILPIKLAKKYPFPTFEGEKFVTEDLLYDVIDKNAVLKLMPEKVTICKYHSDGLSNNLNKIMKSNPAGYCLYFMQRIDMQDNFKNRIITAGKYNCFKIFAGKKACKYTGNYKKQVVLAKIPGYIFWLYYKIIRHF